MNTNRFNAYRSMWIMVLFDLPTETKKERKVAARFRKRLLENGYTMFQFSIYMRFCQSKENAEMHTKHVRNNLPDKGKVAVFAITDKQFERMEIFYGENKQSSIPPIEQLTLF